MNSVASGRENPCRLPGYGLELVTLAHHVCNRFSIVSVYHNLCEKSKTGRLTKCRNQVSHPGVVKEIIVENKNTTGLSARVSDLIMTLRTQSVRINPLPLPSAPRETP